MKIIADENIPFITELFSDWGEVILLPGREIRPNHVIDADILLVRSVTPVDENLLHSSKVKFVGTATTGTEHIDIAWLEKNNIKFATAKGSNAQAVAEYVIGCVAGLRKKNLLCGNSLAAGVIGIGNVGSKVTQKLQQLGFEVLQNDPPRSQNDSAFISTALTKFSDLDLICLHTPLTKHGDHPTYHLIDDNFLKKLKPGAVLLNAGRGAVIDFTALKKYDQLHLCLDVWEHEPSIDLDILRESIVATPHIAGYSVEAKSQGAFMLYQKACAFFQKSAVFTDNSAFSPKINLPLNSVIKTWEDIVLQVYDPIKDTEQMKASLFAATDVAYNFDNLRKYYPRRHEFESVVLKNKEILPKHVFTIIQKLGFK